MSVGKSIEVLIQGPLAAQSVDELMDDVQVKHKKLRSRMDLIISRRQFWISKDAESSVHQGIILVAGQAKIKDQVDSTAHDIKDVAYNVKDLANQLQEIHAMMQQQEKIHAKAHEDSLKRDVCNQWLALLGDSHKKRSKDHKIYLTYRFSMLT